LAKKTDRDIVVGLDIGTSKVLALVGEITADGAIEVIAWAASLRADSRRAWSSTSNPLCSSIQRAVEEAELMADCEINAV